MIPVTCFEGKPVAVFGLGRTGLAAARALVAGGAESCLGREPKPAARPRPREGCRRSRPHRRSTGRDSPP